MENIKIYGTLVSGLLNGKVVKASEVEGIEDYVGGGSADIVQELGDSENKVISQKVVTEELNTIKNILFPVKTSFSIAPPGPIEFTGTKNVTLSWSISKGGDISLDVQNIQLKKGNTVLYNTPIPSGNFTSTVDILGTTTFKCVFNYDNTSEEKTANIKTILPIYIGISKEDSSLSSNKSKMTKKVSESGTFSFDELTADDYNNTKLWIAVPKSSRVARATSGGFTVPMQAVMEDSSIEIESQNYTYNIYKSVDYIYKPIKSLIVTVS